MARRVQCLMNIKRMRGHIQIVPGDVEAVLLRQSRIRHNLAPLGGDVLRKMSRSLLNIEKRSIPRIGAKLAPEHAARRDFSSEAPVASAFASAGSSHAHRLDDRQLAIADTVKNIG